MRLDKAVARLERALDRSQHAHKDVTEELEGMREFEGRLKTADARLGSVILELKTMLEHADAPGDGKDQRP